MGRRIALLFHERMPPARLDDYNLSRLIPIWEADGHEVVLLFGVKERVSADLVFVHVDLSVVPDEYLDFAATFPAAVNGKVRSILKSSYSPNLLRPGDAWPGPVIVKSERNHGGTPEAALGLPRLDGSGTHPAFWSQVDYAVLDHLEEVPDAIFSSPDYVVQRFTPECEDGLFHVRNYQFLGDWHAWSRFAAEDPIVTVETRAATLPCPPAPELMDLRRKLGFDYGKFDYVIHGGEVVLLDINKTTGGRAIRRPPDARLAALHQEKARALYGFFR